MYSKKVILQQEGTRKAHTFARL